jgi:hypothetical protein
MRWCYRTDLGICIRSSFKSKSFKRESKPMKLLKTVLASAVLVASAGANAAVTGALGGGFGTFATLSGLVRPAPAVH